MYVGTPLISKKNVSASASGGVLSGSLTRRTVLNPMHGLKRLCCCADDGSSTCDMRAVTVTQYRRRVAYPAGHQRSYVPGATVICASPWPHLLVDMNYKNIVLVLLRKQAGLCHQDCRVTSSV